MIRLLTLVLFYAAVCVQANPFLSRRAAGDTSAVDTSENVVVEEVASVQNSGSGLRSLFAGVVRGQRHLNSRIYAEFRRIGTAARGGAGAVLMMIAFGYGVLHALGPGHAKVVIGSYALGSGVGFAKIAVASLLFGLTHAGMAVLFFLGLETAFTSIGVGRERITDFFFRISGGVLVAVGLLQVGEIVRDRSKKDGESGSSGTTGRPFALVAVSAGLAPCPGALLILMVSRINEAVGHGIAAVLFLSLGMAVTVSMSGFAGGGC